MALLFGVVNTSSPIAASIPSRLTDNSSPIGAVAPELPDNISPFMSSFEIQAHLTIGETARALDLIRRSWGWYANHPNGTCSTVIEGYRANGTFGYRSERGYGYDPSYVSHAHGWSSGPTSALTEYVVGLSVTSPADRTWKIKSQFGDLKRAEAGFVTRLGKFQAKWERAVRAYTLSFEAPVGTNGVMSLPVLNMGSEAVITVNGKVLGSGQYALEAGHAVLNFEGDKHNIIVSY